MPTTAKIMCNSTELEPAYGAFLATRFALFGIISFEDSQFAVANSAGPLTRTLELGPALAGTPNSKVWRRKVHKNELQTGMNLKE